MTNIHKRLVICKKEDWAFCFSHNIVREGDGVTLSDGMTSGLFCLRAIDSGENGFEWSRVSLGCRLPADSLIRTYAHSADDKSYGDCSELEEYISGLDAHAARRDLFGIFKPAGHSEDFRLNIHGRYLWLMFEFIATGAPPKLEALRIQMSGDHMIDYLPEIYRKDGDFAKRFLSVFDSIFMDMEMAIYDLPNRFDYESADAEMLNFLAEWVCVEGADLDRETAIERIQSAVNDYEDMFTVRGIARSVKRLCGRQPLIIESADVDPNTPGCVNSALYRRLYGENPYKFFILLDEDSFESRAKMEKFLKDMRKLIPAGTEFELVLLKRSVRLDWHTYLGVNSIVSNYAHVVIDENTTIQYDTTIGGNKVEGF